MRKFTNTTFCSENLQLRTLWKLWLYFGGAQKSATLLLTTWMRAWCQYEQKEESRFLGVKINIYWNGWKTSKSYEKNHHRQPRPLFVTLSPAVRLVRSASGTSSALSCQLPPHPKTPHPPNTHHPHPHLQLNLNSPFVEILTFCAPPVKWFLNFCDMRCIFWCNEVNLRRTYIYDPKKVHVWKKSKLWNSWIWRSVP